MHHLTLRMNQRSFHDFLPIVMMDFFVIRIFIHPDFSPLIVGPDSFWREQVGGLSFRARAQEGIAGPGVRVREQRVHHNSKEVVRKGLV